MPRTPGLAIGPENVDHAGELVARLGVHNRADRLLNRHAQMYPADLVAALSPRPDPVRSAALDLGEVEEALLDLQGRRAFFREGYVLEDAAVRGEGSRRVVSVVYRVPSRDGREDYGRSARGVIPYELVESTVEPRYEELSRQMAEQGVKSPDQLPARFSAPSSDSADAGTEKRLQELERQLRQSTEALQALQEEKEKLSDPQPYEGYDEQNADAVIARVKDDGLGEFGRAGLERMLTYEESHKDRATVKAAIEAELDSATE